MCVYVCAHDVGIARVFATLVLTYVPGLEKLAIKGEGGKGAEETNSDLVNKDKMK